jgi:hypothetical protein
LCDSFCVRQGKEAALFEELARIYCAPDPLHAFYNAQPPPRPFVAMSLVGSTTPSTSGPALSSVLPGPLAAQQFATQAESSSTAYDRKPMPIIHRPPDLMKAFYDANPAPWSFVATSALFPPQTPSASQLQFSPLPFAAHHSATTAPASSSTPFDRTTSMPTIDRPPYPAGAFHDAKPAPRPFGSTPYFVPATPSLLEPRWAEVSPVPLAAQHSVATTLSSMPNGWTTSQQTIYHAPNPLKAVHSDVKPPPRPFDGTSLWLPPAPLRLEPRLAESSQVPFAADHTVSTAAVSSSSATTRYNATSMPTMPPSTTSATSASVAGSTSV